MSWATAEGSLSAGLPASRIPQGSAMEDNRRQKGGNASAVGSLLSGKNTRGSESGALSGGSPEKKNNSSSRRRRSSVTGIDEKKKISSMLTTARL